MFCTVKLKSSMSKKFMISLLRKLALCLFILTCAVCYGRIYFYRDPGSRFFDKGRAYEQRYSLHRKNEASAFISEQSVLDQKSPAIKASGNASLCVAFSSVKRQTTQYVEIALASLLSGLTPHERADINVNVLIAHTKPDEHPAWRQKWVKDAVDELYSYNVSSERNISLQNLESQKNHAAKGVYDYTYAMEHCYEKETPYIGLFEDDVLLADGWLVRTLIGLRDIEKYRKTDRPWLYMRLFNEERATGWATKRIGGNHEFWIILGIDLGIIVPVLLTRKLWPRTKDRLSLESMFVLVGVLIPSLVILFYQSGKASLLPPSPGVFNEPFGCCSQLMVFPRSQVPTTLEYLRGRREGQIDLMLNDLAEDKDLTRYALYPVQAQHIGLDSARDTVLSEAQAVWSMAYEDLNPKKLRKAHEEMVADYYG